MKGAPRYARIREEQGNLLPKREGDRVPVLGITGGIASGKSTFARRLTPLISGRLFDADLEARRLLESNAEVQGAICAEFGDSILTADNGIDRARLRKIVFHDGEARKRLEAILHPAIRSAWITLAKEIRHEIKRGQEWLVVDIPLLYETDADRECDVVAVVACQQSTQETRIVSERGLSASMAQQIIGAQQTLCSKVARAPHVIWSEVSLAVLDQQAALFAAYLLECYG